MFIHFRFCLHLQVEGLGLIFFKPNFLPVIESLTFIFIGSTSVFKVLGSVWSDMRRKGHAQTDSKFQAHLSPSSASGKLLSLYAFG